MASRQFMTLTKCAIWHLKRWIQGVLKNVVVYNFCGGFAAASTVCQDAHMHGCICKCTTGHALVLLMYINIFQRSFYSRPQECWSANQTLEAGFPRDIWIQSAVNHFASPVSEDDYAPNEGYAKASGRCPLSCFCLSAIYCTFVCIVLRIQLSPLLCYDTLVCLWFHSRKGC